MYVNSLYIHNRYLWLTLSFFTLLLAMTACEKLTEVTPPITEITNARTFGSDGNAIAAITGLYTNMQPTFTGVNGLSVHCGLSADELTLSAGVTTSDPRNFVYKNSLFVSSSVGSFNFWTPLYNCLYNCNTALIGLGNTQKLTLAIRQQLLGETLFLRAFYYYYLLALYGDVPLVLGTDYKINASLSRTPARQVWLQIIKDLDSAKHMLSPNYLDGSLLHATLERVRPTQGAAIALLARANLYTSNWKEAEIQASILIENTAVYNLDSLKNVFLKNSKEAIWQLQPVVLGWNAPDATAFIIPPTGLDNQAYAVYLNMRLYNIFEVQDQRRTEWIDSVIVTNTTYYYPHKYKSATYGNPITEYQMILRLGEQYLIRAEARAHQGNINGAQADLNIIRHRAGLPSTTATTQSALLTAILLERRTELFTELGQRWLDLKRTGAVDSTMQQETPLKANGAPWHSYQQVYPIPQADVQSNPHLSQNMGY